MSRGREKRAISRRERSSTSLNLVMLDARHPREKALYHLPHQEKRILKGSTRPFLLLKSSLDDVNAAASLSNTITESKVWILTIILHSVTSVANECKKRYSSISLENFRFVWSFEGCCCLLFKSACQRLFSQLENVRCSSSIFLLHFPLHSTELQMPPLQMH